MTTNRSQMFGRAALEALVIFVSVMVALAADRWVAGLDERAEAAELLVQLESNIRADSARVAGALSTARTKQRLAADLLAGSTTADSVDIPTFLAEFERVGWLSRAEFQTATWRDLVASGRASLIEDRELREALAFYYDRADLLTRLQGYWVETSRIYQERANRVVPALVRVGILGALPAGARPQEPTQRDVDAVLRALETDELLRTELSAVMVAYSGQISLYPLFLEQVEVVLEELRGAL